MPQFQEVQVRIDAGSEPLSEATQLSLTADGHVTYVLDDASVAKFITVDSTGNVSSRWGRSGSGPGENRGGMLLGGDSTVIVVAPIISAIQVYTANGKLLKDVRGATHDALPLAVVGDSIDWSYSQRLVGMNHVIADVHGPLTRECIDGTCRRVLLQPEDSAWRTVHMATPRHEGTQWPPYAAEPGRFVFGDGVTYRLWIYETNGSSRQFSRELPRRTLQPRELAADEEAWAKRRAMDSSVDINALRAFALSEPLPHFTYGGLGFDDKHRLVVVGKTHDSTFIDVFADTVFLGRTTLDCVRDRGRAAVRGHWVALMCQNGSSTEQPIRLRLFRITG